MALSESGLAAKGVFPSGMAASAQGGKRVVAPSKGKGKPKSNKMNFYVKAKGK